jgi:hypothetical protein
MKNILAWVKANLLVVIFSAVILLVLPGAFVGSTLWRSATLDKQKKIGESEFNSVRDLSVTYTLPNYRPGTEPVTVKSEPNPKLTQWFQEQKARLTAASSTIVERVVAFNKGTGPDAVSVNRTEFVPLVEGLFPDPKSDESADKLNSMEDALLGKRGKPNPYELLLQSARAGMPADAAKVAEVLRDLVQRETEKITASKRALTPEEQVTVNKLLAERRLAEYRAHANTISVYANLDTLPKDPKNSAIARGRIDPDTLNVPTMFVYQWDLWVLQDILAAVALANTDSSGDPTGVGRSVVKRIDGIALDVPKGLYKAKTEEGAMPEGEVAAPVAAIPGMVPTDPRVSITGRMSGNEMFDLRVAKLSVVVSASRLNEFLDAIVRTNLMSVLDVDIAKVDLWEELKDGYFYGDEGVVRADITIETVWLRSWMVNFMPKDVRGAFGIVDPAGADGSTAPAAAPAAPTEETSGGEPAPRGRMRNVAPPG